MKVERVESAHVTHLAVWVASSEKRGIYSIRPLCGRPLPRPVKYVHGPPDKPLCRDCAHVADAVADARRNTP